MGGAVAKTTWFLELLRTYLKVYALYSIDLQL